MEDSLKVFSTLVWLLLLTRPLNVRGQAAGYGPLSGSPTGSDLTDMMGQVRLQNSVQCQRLCWYRPLCGAFSFDEFSTTGVNCVLHSATVKTANGALPENWVRREATNEGITGYCALRPCAATEVCLSMMLANGVVSGKCVSYPASCTTPRNITMGTLVWSGTRQGDTATLTCQTGYVVRPLGSSGQLTCDVAAQWLPADVMCSQLVNVALHKPANQSTTPYVPPKGAASNAVDGNTDGMFFNATCSHTAKETPHRSWWQVDLQANYGIHHVTIYNRLDCCPERLRDFDIHVYTEDPTVNPSTTAILCYHHSGPIAGNFANVTCQNQPMGSFVRITNYPDALLTLCEVQVYGAP